jgi:hypothetical protein
VRRTVFQQAWRNASGVRVLGDERHESAHHRNLAYEMDRARFCLVLPGAGYTTRGTLAVMRGCVPVLVGDNIAQPFGDLYDYTQFSVSVPESNVHNMLHVLEAVTEETQSAMRAQLAELAPRLMWEEGDAQGGAFETTMRALANVLPR